jgi:hypothetical protein
MEVFSQLSTLMGMHWVCNRKKRLQMNWRRTLIPAEPSHIKEDRKYVTTTVNVFSQAYIWVHFTAFFTLTIHQMLFAKNYSLKCSIVNNNKCPQFSFSWEILFTLARNSFVLGVREVALDPEGRKRSLHSLCFLDFLLVPKQGCCSHHVSKGKNSYL